MGASPVWFVGRRFFSAGSQTALASFIAVLAMVGLVAGVALLIIVLSIMNGFDREMRERILGIVPHIQVFEPGGIDNWQALARQLEANPAVLGATPYTRFQGLLSAKGEVVPVQVQGLEPSALDPGLSRALPESVDQWLASDGMVLSGTVASRLGLVPGDRLTLMVPRDNGQGRALTPAIRRFTLAGVVNTHTQEDNGLALVNLGIAGQLTGLGSRPEGLRLEIDDVFRARAIGYELMAGLSPRFRFIDWHQTHGNLHQAIDMSRQLVGLLIFLIIAIAVFNVVSMLVMTVVDKRPAVAILKTLGADNRTILGVFFVQGSLIGLFGVGIGVVLGVLGAESVTGLVSWIEQAAGFRFLDSAIYPVDYLPSQLHWADVVTVAAVALGLNLVASLYPAWLAARVRPAEVLRYE